MTDIIKWIQNESLTERTSSLIDQFSVHLINIKTEGYTYMHISEPRKMMSLIENTIQQYKTFHFKYYYPPLLLSGDDLWKGAMNSMDVAIIDLFVGGKWS